MDEAIENELDMALADETRVSQLDNADVAAAGVQKPTPQENGPHLPNVYWDTGAPFPTYPTGLGLVSRAEAMSPRGYFVSKDEMFDESYHKAFARRLEQGKDRPDRLTQWWLVFPFRVSSENGDVDALHPMRGGAWFRHFQDAETFREDLARGWAAWSARTYLEPSTQDLFFGCVPIHAMGKTDLAATVWSGHAQKELVDKIRSLVGDNVQDFVHKCRVFEDLTLDGGGGPDTPSLTIDEFMWDSERDMPRWPTCWLAEVTLVRYRHACILRAREHGYAATMRTSALSYAPPAEYSRDVPPHAFRGNSSSMLAPAAIVPWVEYVGENAAPMIRPWPRVVAVFEHVGLACQYAMLQAYLLGHLAGRTPAPHEITTGYMIQQVFVYDQWGKDTLGETTGCGSRPFAFACALTHGGVQTMHSEHGHSRDNEAIPADAKTLEKLLGSIVDSTGKPMSIDSFMDSTPT